MEGSHGEGEGGYSKRTDPSGGRVLFFDSLVCDCSFMCIRILFYTCYPFLRISFINIFSGKFKKRCVIYYHSGGF